MAFETVDVIEKSLLVDSKRWRPDASLLMHVASFDDYGAHPDSIEETTNLMKEEGLAPQKIKLRIIVEIEHL